MDKDLRFDLVVIGAISMVLVLAIGGFWYSTIYNTPKGRCQRGDFYACLVWQAEAPQPVVRLSPQDAQPTPGYFDCYASVSDHDAVVGISTAVACDYVQQSLAPLGFNGSAVEIPAHDHLVCSVVSSRWAAEVWDSGGALYGDEACATLRGLVN